jgi:ATP-dependent Lon protease
MSLGGVRDEAEIRGHRRTYVGAIPGRIITSIRDCGVNNPVFLFDEIDKVGSDYRGDPAAALLEVLDPEQNKDFKDHFLDVPFDLSKVLFITTANTTDTIPRPLLDRMELINLSSYTEEEKVEIGKQHLIPKQIKENGLKPDQISMSEAALRNIINYYTREAGVRNLEREIGSVCRKVARKVVEASPKDKKKVYRITAGNLESYLGKKKAHYDIIEGDNEVGVTTGLAWTTVGGDTLFIETTVMNGSGKLVLTGQLGDVMQESAKAGLSVIRSRCEQLGIDENFYKEKDIHIHIPEGATPKDGPSAGVTMCTSMISALTGIPVKKEIAMTGEITLRGNVLPVGGIKEKMIAAHRAGVKTVLLPEENLKDLDELPSNVRNAMTFKGMKTIDQVLDEALAR